jgi:hypothetical protein
MVATLGETTGYLALIRLQQKMLADPVGAEILRSESVQICLEKVILWKYYKQERKWHVLTSY